MRIVILLASLGASASNPSEGETWVGHQVVRGARSFPVLGDLEIETQSFVVAEVERQGKAFTLRQRACQVKIRPTLGVAVRMPERLLRQLPVVSIRVLPERSGILRAQPWELSWGREDVDGDGNPGGTINVDSSLCGGDVYVANETLSAAEGRLDGTGLSGWISVHIQQQVLGASGICLRLATGDTDEWQRGRFAYRPVPAGTTCESLAGKPWPVTATREMAVLP